ncbi:LamB/YcsF family protein [Bacillus sp. HMF5848]|uniref:5-oxoprolinase subunit PxpA n=1 Tax=Bacillus sp. HMF5848 TaxID=2495421 RepID=UPI000F775025|nr:5-oxoprolinase subunit PxpA [Bacillus sp. HMF5848]RSK29005.1 LamB/YcsF family protein [Bacillus sp. HMF5848]
MKKIDINCDMGEGYGSYIVGNDEEVMPYITSANIACGFHAGDPHIMNRTVEQAKSYGVAIGAHPGYPDLAGFGRRSIPMSTEEITNITLAQLGTLHSFCRAHKVDLHHIKPHGALYNDAAKNITIAHAIIKAIKQFDDQLILYGLANSALIEAAIEAGIRVASEVFADRTYENDGSLTPRSQPNAVISNVNECVEQARRMINDKQVLTVTGELIPIDVDTICIHGDSPHALSIAQALRNMLNFN